MTHSALPRLLKSAIAAGALLSLGGCMYGGSGYYGDGYVNNSRYDCDPYAPFDDYYACDTGYGFANIGYGGGWYDQYYYPGHGVYVFDRGGRRHAMRDRDRYYWARQRAAYGGHHARGRDYRRGQDYRRGERADWRDRGHGDRDGVRDGRRGHYRDRGDRDDPRVRNRPGARPGNRVTRPDSVGQAAPVRNRPDRTSQPVRRPTGAIQQPQARPPVARPAQARPARPEGPRTSPRMNRVDRQHVQDQ